MVLLDSGRQVVKYLQEAAQSLSHCVNVSLRLRVSVSRRCRSFRATSPPPVHTLRARTDASHLHAASRRTDNETGDSRSRTNSIAARFGRARARSGPRLQTQRYRHALSRVAASGIALTPETITRRACYFWIGRASSHRAEKLGHLLRLLASWRGKHGPASDVPLVWRTDAIAWPGYGLLQRQPRRSGRMRKELVLWIELEADNGRGGYGCAFIFVTVPSLPPAFRHLRPLHPLGQQCLLCVRNYWANRLIDLA